MLLFSPCITRSGLVVSLALSLLLYCIMAPPAECQVGERHSGRTAARIKPALRRAGLSLGILKKIAFVRVANSPDVDDV